MARRFWTFAVALSLPVLAAAQTSGWVEEMPKAPNPEVRIIGTHLRGGILETPHPYEGSAAEGVEEQVWQDEFHYPGAAYLVFEFDTFDLAPGDRVEVMDPAGKQVHVYTGKGFLPDGGAFITKMVLGPDAVIRLISTSSNADGHYGYRIQRVSRGLSPGEISALYGGPDGLNGYDPESTCGANDLQDAKCFEASQPAVYDSARSVARIVMDGSALCTGWLVSCDDHLLTNNHCTWDDNDFDTQGELNRMEWQFMYQDASCGGGSPAFEYSFMGGTWLENHANLDYTLVQAPASENPAATYGWLLLDLRTAIIGEQMYIVGHPAGRPKEIAYYSTQAGDTGGLCRVQSITSPVCIGGSVQEVGYTCDTEGGNSGSPVFAYSNHKVIALHHCGTCNNRGVPITNVYNSIQAAAPVLPSCSTNDEMGSVELDATAYNCADTIGIEVNDGSLVGAGTVGVTIWSTLEPTPENRTLAETPANSGTFVGSINTTSAAPVNGNGVLSVANGNTITVRYIDADDGAGGTNVQRQDTATADCTAPVISAVAAINVTGNSATITWTTNEPANSLATAGTNTPPSGFNGSDATLVTSHSVNLTGLSECTTYKFLVTSADAAGNSTTATNGGAYYTFSTSKNVNPTYVSTDVPKAIPDNNPTGASSNLTVADTKVIQDVDVLVNLTHTYDGDLDLILIGPDATQIILSNNRGGSGDNFTSTWFSDEGSTGISTGTAPFTGTYIPDEALSAFDGKTANGTWTLKVVDSASIDTGSITGWSLRLLFPAESCAPGEVAGNNGLLWAGGSKTQLNWPAESVSTSYRVYRGQGASSLPNLLTSGNDSCLRASPATNTVTGLSETPPANDFYWYLVTGANGSGEGPAGPATAGARIVNSTGTCL